MTHSSHSKRIGGKQARELLNGTTPGPWLAMDYEHALRSIGPIYGDSLAAPEVGDGYLIASDADAELTAAAPALAETVAWLYGREPEHPDMGIHSVPLMRFSGNDADVVYAAKGGAIVFDVDGGFRSIEEAEDFARAVLAVVEESRREARP